MRNWFHFNWLCGDNIVEQHCHNIDVGNWFHSLGDPHGPNAHPIKCNAMGTRSAQVPASTFRSPLRPLLLRIHIRRRQPNVQPVPPYRELLEQRQRDVLRRRRNRGQVYQRLRRNSSGVSKVRTRIRTSTNTSAREIYPRRRKAQRALVRRQQPMTSVLGERRVLRSGNHGDALSKICDNSRTISLPISGEQSDRFLGRYSADHARYRSAGQPGEGEFIYENSVRSRVNEVERLIIV